MPTKKRLLALLLIVGLVAAACSNSKEEGGSGGKPVEKGSGPNNSPGVSDDEIRFSAFGTIANNPLGTCVLECYVHGIEAYFAYRNSEGGVHGRDLVLDEPLDDAMAKNQQLAIEITTADETFAAFSATQVASGWQDVAKAGMPLYVWLISPAEATHPNTFGNQGVPCITCPRRIDAYSAQLAGGTKVGILGYGVSEASKKSAASKKAAIETYSADIGGAEVAYFNDGVAFGMPNGVGPEVTAMKNAGVDVIMTAIDLNGMKTLGEELKRQGMDDVVMIHNNTYDHAFVKEAGDVFEGDYVSVTFRPFEADAEGSELGNFLKWMEETGQEPTEPAMSGWINADTAYQGILEAGPEFDREKVIAASNEKLTEYTAGGLVSPIDFSKQHEPPTLEDLASHSGPYDCAAMVKIKDGEFEALDAAKPWTCWTSENRNWAEPEQMNFT